MERLVAGKSGLTKPLPIRNPNAIADDVLRDLFVRGKYRDVILPMCVIRRLDAVLAPTKKAVLETKERLDKLEITEQQAALL